jgi:hypothetical protein
MACQSWLIQRDHVTKILDATTVATSASATLGVTPVLGDGGERVGV